MAGVLKYLKLRLNLPLHRESSRSDVKESIFVKGYLDKHWTLHGAGSPYELEVRARRAFEDLLKKSVMQLSFCIIKRLLNSISIAY